MFSGEEEEGREAEKRERVERGYGPPPRPGRAQSTRCKNANRPPPTRFSSKKKRGGKGKAIEGNCKEMLQNVENQKRITASSAVRASALNGRSF